MNSWVLWKFRHTQCTWSLRDYAREKYLWDRQAGNEKHNFKNATYIKTNNRHSAYSMHMLNRKRGLGPINDRADSNKLVKKNMQEFSRKKIHIPLYQHRNSLNNEQKRKPSPVNYYKILNWNTHACKHKQKVDNSLAYSTDSAHSGPKRSTHY